MIIIEFILYLLGAIVFFMFILYKALSTLERCPECGDREVIEHDTEPITLKNSMHCPKCKYEF